MSSKSGKIAELVAQFGGNASNPNYVAFVECFNRGLFFESHEVLEAIWLGDRRGKNGAFYKGLIQLAGAFVHLQKDRLGPAAALFRLARANLRDYPEVHEGLEVTGLLREIETWLARLEAGGSAGNPLQSHAAPQLVLKER